MSIRTRLSATSRLLALVSVLSVLAPATPTFAYLKLGVSVNGESRELKWTSMPVRYYVSDHGVPNVTSSQLRDTVGRAFATWEAVPSASIRYQFASFTSALPGEDDGWTTLGFLAMPELDRVLAATSFLIDEATGELLESDIFFNASFDWSTDPSGQTNRFDLETIALHEIGHLSGLSHSALGETELLSDRRRVSATAAVMFPIAFPPGTTANRVLRPDDIAGISDLYPDNGFDANTGSMSGQVTKNGKGVLGAHIVAMNPSTGALIGNFSLDASGAFSIAGLAPGPYVVRAEPLDDAEIDSFFDVDEAIDVSFRTAFYSRVVVVPKGGDSGTIQVKVVPK